MSHVINVDETIDFQRVIIEQRPLIDVRAPVEFSSGSLPGAVNLPIMTDEERRKVGTCYKQRGREAAIKLGSRLVSGDIRGERLADWVEMISDNPQTMVYCSRGGLRSHIVQEWVQAETGQCVPLLEGGYKAFRGYLLGRLDPTSVQSEAIVVGGRTGVGKTVLINTLKNSIDLEAIANHRGSSFGRHISAQPVQADFENLLAAALIKHGFHNFRHVIVEDEGRHIGKRFILKRLADFFAGGQVIILEASLEERIERTCNEYVLDAQEIYLARFGTSHGLEKWIVDIESAVDRIARRLGPLRYGQVREQLDDACVVQGKTGNPDMHKIWIEQLLTFYYDPMYDFQLEKDKRKVIFKGDQAAVKDYLKSLEREKTE